ncbi:Nramp family divalent metal transporter [Zobellella iuensis]|uniref:Nramp family divalent metal transporter n=1 Tax=Zobellella iuensis TaxID=2803811 RepID=A0ABS1QM24_9GAMM|nr:Nramp family divalent metal transporter [Zobellella iuensis]MBL1375905.1 Nramp family divalent metal transporter [Zobellella iuensis]
MAELVEVAESGPRSISHYMRVLGPGILGAAAAIGGSHLVASTQAGAIYGWQLVGLIIVVNLLKYPFFQIGARYTMAADETLIQGYDRIGRGYLYLFTALNIFASVVSTAGVAMLCGSILGLFIGDSLSVTQLSMIVLAGSLVFLITGHYKTLDRVTKWIIVGLAVATVTAVFIALNQGGVATPDFVAPSPWNLAAVGFLVALMGWMPAPIELSSWNSVWLRQKKKALGDELDYKDALVDFNVGYITSTLLAIAFVALGALVLHGSGESLATSGIAFAHQLVNVYASVMGDWSRWLIALIAFLCMFSTTVTVLDGYSRALSECFVQLGQQKGSGPTGHGARYTYPLMVVMGLVGALIIMFFKGALLAMLEFAMISAFISALVFAWLNYRLMKLPQVPERYRLGGAMVALSWAGILFFAGFNLLFGYWYLFVK